MPADFLLRNTSTGALMILSGDTPLDAAALVEPGTYKVRAMSAEADADLVVPAVGPGTSPDDIIALWGQSEPANLYSVGYEDDYDGEETVLADNMVTFWWSNRASTDYATEVRNHVMTAADGYNSRFTRMANAWIRQNPGRSVAIVLHTKPGGNFNELVGDSVGGWDWAHDAALEDALNAAYGNKPTDLVLFSWTGSPSTYGGDYGRALHEIVFGETIDGTSIGSLPATIIPGHPNEFTADHLLTEFYDWSVSKLAVLEPHRFESNAVKYAQVREAIRRMYRYSVNGSVFRKANAVLSYSNGYGATTVTDEIHPSPGEGSRRYGEGLIYSAMQAMGLRPQGHIEIDQSYWEPAGDYVEVWSSQGPVRTIDGSPAGMKLNGTFFDAEITNFNRMRLTAATVGRQLTDTDALEVLPNSVAQTSAEDGDPASRLDLWRKMPLVRTAPGGSAIPDDVRAVAITAASNGALENAIESATGGEHIIVPAGTNIGNLRLNGANPASEVVIWSDGICAARMSQIYATNCSNLTFRNFHIERAHDAGQNIVILSDFTNMKLIGNVIHSDKYPTPGGDYSTSGPGVMNGIEASGGDNRNLTVEGNYIGGLYISLRGKVNGLLRVADNFFELAYEDHIKLSHPTEAAAATEIVGNYMRGVVARGTDLNNPHADLIQFIGRTAASFDWANITITDNVIISEQFGQGIFMDDIGNGYKFVATIENNLIALPQRNTVIGCGIKMQFAGDGTVIRANTIVTMDPLGTESTGPGIIVGNFGSSGSILVENNIAEAITLLGDATYTETGNVVLGGGGSTISFDTVFGATFDNPVLGSFNEAMLRFVGRGDYAGVGADLRNRVSLLLDGIPVANDPDPATVLVNTISDVADPPSGETYALAGDTRIQRDAEHATTTAAYTALFRLKIDNTGGGYKRLFYDNTPVFTVEASATAPGFLRVSAPNFGPIEKSGAFTVGTMVDFMVAVNAGTGDLRVYVNGSEITELRRTGAAWSWALNRDLRGLGLGNGAGDGIIGEIERFRLWDEYSPDGSVPTGTPAKDLQGGTFVADAAADPRWLVVKSNTALS